MANTSEIRSRGLTTEAFPSFRARKVNSEERVVSTPADTSRIVTITPWRR